MYLNKNNNFDIIRLVLAVIVFLAHMSELTKFKELNIINNFLSTNFAIKSFFVISGFLIFMSYERSSDLKKYFINRVLRIYPAYIAIIFFSSILLYFSTNLKFFEYFNFSYIEYIIFNLLFLNFLEPSLPGVFENNNFSAVNGALWTLKIEVAFYLVVPFLTFLFKKYNTLKIILSLYFLSFIYTQTMLFMYEETTLEIYNILSRQFPAQLSYFMVGAFSFYYYNKLSKNITLLVFSSLLLLIISSVFNFSLIEPIGVGFFIISLSTLKYLGNYTPFGDLSYGIYIVHFPLIQFLYNVDYLKNNPYIFILMTIITVISISLIFWHLIEKRFLSFKSN